MCLTKFGEDVHFQALDEKVRRPYRSTTAIALVLATCPPPPSNRPRTELQVNKPPPPFSFPSVYLPDVTMSLNLS